MFVCLCSVCLCGHGVCVCMCVCVCGVHIHIWAVKFTAACAFENLGGFQYVLFGRIFVSYR